MNRLAEDVFHMPLIPRNGLNAYLVGDVLVDAGLAQSGKKIVKAVAGHGVRIHLLTHAHGDHAGGSRHVCEAVGASLWCGAADAEAVAAGKPVAASRIQAMFKWAPVEVARELREGDEIGSSFVALDVPGHSPGHIALWRERDRTLVCGDVLTNMNVFTTAVGLHEPPGFLTPDPARNREAIRRLAELEPELVLFGHGPPLRDPAKLKEFAGSLERG